MDGISLSDKGLKNACATLGTALNKEHAKLMMKYTKNVVLCYDADEAGRNATLRAIDILSAEGLEPRVLALENGEDPDSYVVKYGRGAFEQRVAQSVYYTDYKINILKEKYDLNDIVQMAAFIKEASAAAAQTKDEIKWDYYVKKIASMTQAEPVLIKNQIAKCAKDGGGAAPDELMQTAAPGAAEEAQKCILKYLLDDAAHMADFYAAGGDLGCFIGEDYALLYEEIEKCYSADRNVDILKHLAYNNKLASLAVAVDSHAAVSDLDQIKDCIKTLRIGLYETELKALKRRIEASEKEADGVDASLLKEYSYLKKKLLDTKSEVKRI
jgi:DNA primase